MKPRHKRARSGMPGLTEKKDNPKRTKWIAGVVVLLLAILLPASAWFLSKSMVPEYREFHIPLKGAEKGGDTLLLTTGQKLINSMLKNGTAEMAFLETRTGMPVLTFRIYKKGDWEKRNPFTQLSIAAYLESLVPQARILVSLFIPQGRDNPNYESLAANIQANLCSSCWAIAEGSETLRYLAAGVSVIGAYPETPGIQTIQELRQRSEENRQKQHYRDK